MNRLSKFVLLALAGWGLPMIASAQTTQTQEPVRQRVVVAEGDKALTEQRMVIEGGGRGGVIAPVETRVTPGRPYSAEAITESVQVLGDGNRITKKGVTRVYRDNDGRTRREQVGADGAIQTITINDPVAGPGYSLNPATRTGTQNNVVALRSGTFVNAVPSGEGLSGARGGAGGGGRGRGAGGGAQSVETQAELEEKYRKLEQAKATAARVEQAETSRAASTQAKQVIELAASGGGRTAKEELGEQSIEGVRATGTRSTTVIPAGAIGNMNEIRIVSEQWFSPDLEVLVLTKHSDPRVGETVYRLTNIVRAQPDPNLFTPPADYTIRGRAVR